MLVSYSMGTKAAVVVQEIMVIRRKRACVLETKKLKGTVHIRTSLQHLTRDRVVAQLPSLHVIAVARRDVGITVETLEGVLLLTRAIAAHTIDIVPGPDQETGIIDALAQLYAVGMIITGATLIGTAEHVLEVIVVKAKSMEMSLVAFAKIKVLAF